MGWRIILVDHFHFEDHPYMIRKSMTGVYEVSPGFFGLRWEGNPEARTTYENWLCEYFVEAKATKWGWRIALHFRASSNIICLKSSSVLALLSDRSAFDMQPVVTAFCILVGLSLLCLVIICCIEMKLISGKKRKTTQPQQFQHQKRTKLTT